MSWLYQRQCYLVPRQQTVRHSDGRKVVTTRYGPRSWTRTTTHRDGTTSVARSTNDGPLTKVVGVAMLVVAPGAFLGLYSIPVYLAAVVVGMLWVTHRTRGRQPSKPEAAVPATRCATDGTRAGAAEETIAEVLEPTPEAVRSRVAIKPVAEPRPVEAPAIRSVVATGATFWVYDNRVHRFSKVHRAGCTFCNGGRGLHDRGAHAVAGTWLGPFTHFAGAMAAARTTGRSVSTCSVCAPS